MNEKCWLCKRIYGRCPVHGTISLKALKELLIKIKKFFFLKKLK
jgi:hypothetical protein